MKFFLLARSLQRGGAERQIVVLAHSLREAGHEVVIGLFYPGGPFADELLATGIRMVSPVKRGRWDWFGFWWRLRRIVRIEKPDCIYTFMEVPNLVGAVLKLSGVGGLLLWGVRSSNMAWKDYNWLAGSAYRFTRLMSRVPDVIICNSRAGMDFYAEEGFPAQRMRVIPNGIDTSRFRWDPELRKSQRAQWNLRDDVLAVGIVGRVDPMKDHDTFVEAAAAVADAMSDVVFICVGDGSPTQKSALAAKAEQYGLGARMRWLPSVSDVAPIYNGLDVLVSSSAYGEGFSNVVAEAMACGVKCVVTDVGDNRLLVADHGKVVPPRSPGELANAVIQVAPVARDPKLRQEAANGFHGRYTPEGMTAAVLDVATAMTD